MHGLQARLTAFVDNPRVQNTLIGVIVFNAIILGLETSDTVMSVTGPLIPVLDSLCLMIFVVELTVKFVGYGPLAFFRNPWTVFDFLIVGISLLPDAGSLTVLRALRILRVLRVISVAPRLQRVVEGFLSALPGMGSVFLLLGIIFYIGAVMATRLFADSFPEWFGTIGRSLYSLFQIMTLESWSAGIARPVMELHPYAWAFFIPFIMVTTFAVVNLLVGLIVNSMQAAHEADELAKNEAYRAEVLRRLEAIEAKLAEK
jgi:voltage-gated sodium channel